MLNGAIAPLVALVMAVLFCAPAHAQESAEAVMLRYVDAMKSSDTEVIADLMHPQALQEFREPFDAAFAGDVREQALQELLPLFSVSTYEEFTALTDREVYKRLNETLMQSAPELVELMAASDFEITDERRRGDMVFITYELQTPVNDEQLSQEIEQGLKIHEGEWRLLLPPDDATPAVP